MNTAQRLYKLLSEATKQGGNSSTLEIWAKVLGITAKGQHKRAAEVGSRLSMLHKQVELLVAQMSATAIPESVYDPPLRKVERALSTESLTTPWKNYKPMLSDEVMLSLRYNDAILGNQEETISEDDISSLLQDVDNLASSLKDSDLPTAVIDFIEKQVESIRQALSEYKICGASAIREAVHTGTGQLIEHEELIQQNIDSDAVQGLGRLWQCFAKMGDVIIKADRVLESGQRIYGFIESVFKS